MFVKRTKLKNQYTLFLNYRYWIAATNLCKKEYDNEVIIKLHAERGTMERRIGELKHQLNLVRVKCGQL
jgi:hypothetical protein